MGKGQNAGNQHLVFPQSFFPYLREINIQATLSSAKASNLIKAKILSFSKEVKFKPSTGKTQERHE